MPKKENLTKKKRENEFLFKYNIFICLLNKNNMTMKLHILAYGLVLATTVAACSDEKKRF